jgi:hypothetical protein
LPRKVVSDKSKISFELKPVIEDVTSNGDVLITFNRDVIIPEHFKLFDKNIVEIKLIRKKFNITSRLLSAA